MSGLELVTGAGELLRADAEENPDVLDFARLGLGALGILTSVTLEVEPMFTLEAHEAPMSWDEGLDRFEEMASENHHFEMFWFPHTERLLTKRNNRTLDPPEPLSRARRWVDDEFLANRVFGWANRVGNRRPRPGPQAQRAVRAGAERAPLLRRAAPGVHVTEEGGVPRDGVRPAARGRRGRAARGAGADRGE